MVYIHACLWYICVYVYIIHVYISYIISTDTVNILTSLCPLNQAHHWWCSRCRPMRNVPCAGPQPPSGPCSWLAWQRLGNDEADIFPEHLGVPTMGICIYIYFTSIYIYIYIYYTHVYTHR